MVKSHPKTKFLKGRMHMKRKSLITIFVVILVAILSLTALVACDENQNGSGSSGIYDNSGSSGTQNTSGSGGIYDNSGSSGTQNTSGSEETNNNSASEVKHEFATGWTTDATSHWHVCTVEGHTDTDEKVAHTFNDGVITTPATETTDGIKTFICSVCGYTKTEAVAKLPHTHNFDTATWQKGATNHWHACKGENCTEKQDVAEHTFGSWTEKTPAGVHADKVEHRLCSVCNYEETRTVENTATHTYATDWTKDQTGHWHASTCDHATPLKSDFASHTYGEWIVSKTATVTSAGEKHRTCSVCGYNETATIDKIPSYTITWKNADGTVLETDTLVVEGTTPEYNGATPTKAADETGSYDFKGWTPSVTKATKDATYTAEFTTTYKTYTIEFVMGNGTVAYGNCLYGTKITAPTDTAKKADNTYTYEFTGWDKEITTVTGDTTYTAQYKSTYINYTITFKDYNGTVIPTTRTSYHYGDKVEIPDEPTRDADNTYTYTFKNWGKTVDATCKGDATYTATYTETFIDYTITFKDYDGTVIPTSKETYHYGDTVTEPTAPTRSADKSCSSYEFTGWDKEVTKVNGNATYTATYTGTYIDYTITFVDEDGTVIPTSKTTYHYGDKVDLPQNPTKPSDEDFSYPFTGWTPTVVETVEGNATYKATYGKNAIEHLYTVKFVDYDGKEISGRSDYHVGDNVETPADPTRQADNTYTYAFAGWEPTVSTTCSGDATYKATYTETFIDYTITFVDWDDKVILEKKNYHYGEKVTEPTAPTRAEDAEYTYVFKGWDNEVTTVAKSTTYKAQYTATAIDYTIEYTITFVNDDGTTVATKKYHYNDTIDASDITPTKDSTTQYIYTFSRWSPEFAIVKGNATYTAEYTSELQEYTITFADDTYKDHVYFTKTYKYGETPTVTPEEIPTRESTEGYDYTFSYWLPSFEPVTGEATYRAVFSKKTRKYTVTFKNWDGTELSSGEIEYNATVSTIRPENPTRPADNMNTYQFKWWVNENGEAYYDVCRGTTTYKATYTATPIEYTVTFVNYDNSKETKTYNYGATITEPTFTKPSDETYNYIFAGWDKEVSPTCNGNATYTAQYTKKYINYIIKFVNEDGTELSKKEDYHYGDTVIKPSTTPTKASDNTYTYEFTGWDKEITTVTGDTTYTATYKGIYIDYTITFDQNGGTGGTESATVNYGFNMPTATAPTKSASEFKGYCDKDGVMYYDSQMNSVRTFDKTETLVLTAKWAVVWAYTDETKTSIYFGSYPQTKVTDETLISSLNTLAGEIYINYSSCKWKSYGYYQDGVASDYMFYVDIDYDGDGSFDYRGVYMETYRDESPTGNGNGSTSTKYSYYNGYSKQEKYWFKYEPIKWNILTEADGYATVLADLALDSQQFDFTSKDDYSSNYAESTIRAWLNNTFYNTAFTAMQKALIQTVTVDNRASSNNDSTEVTATPCENTQDQIWLLSYQEAVGINSLARRRQSSDYAKCQGIKVNVDNSTDKNANSSWWLRSPQQEDYAYSIGTTGVPTAVSVKNTPIGIVPALKIKLS